MAPLLDNPNQFKNFQRRVEETIMYKAGNSRHQIVSGELILSFYNGQLCCLVNDRLNDKGLIQIPGGKSEPQDDGIVMTAVRETDEETGLKVIERQSIFGANTTIVLNPNHTPDSNKLVTVSITLMSYVPNPRGEYTPREQDAEKVSESRWVNLMDMISDINENPRKYQHNLKLRFRNPKFIKELIQYLKDISNDNPRKSNSIAIVIEELSSYANTLEG